MLWLFKVEVARGWSFPLCLPVLLMACFYIGIFASSCGAVNAT